MIGQTISRYKVLEKIGEGGMGVVYKAQDSTLDRFVALKFLPQRVVAGPDEKARFLQEAKAAAALNHPNVCTIFGVEESDGSSKFARQMFIVMEYVEGRTLRQEIGGSNAKRSLTPQRAVDIGIQIGDGLMAAHEKGIVHRDLKPENILLQKDGRAKIMDFGLARLKGASRLTKQGITMGTVGYSSPEQVQGIDADHRTDIFSFGVILYEMLAGQPPFKGDNEQVILYQIVGADAKPISSIKPDISPELWEIVQECLAKDPAERYQSAAEVCRNLRRFKHEAGKRRAISTLTRRALRVAKRYVWQTTSFILVAAVVWLGARRWGSSDRPAMRFSMNIASNTGWMISPDSRRLVYTSSNGLFVRSTDESIARSLSALGSELFFSSDGQSIAFFLEANWPFAPGKLKKLSIDGGPPMDICDVDGQIRGGWWAPDNSIFFGSTSMGIQRVPATGGIPEAVTSLDLQRGEVSHRFPQLLPDGKTLIFTVSTTGMNSFDDAVIASQRLDTGERRILLKGGSYARYVPTGHLIFARGKSLFVVPFDLESLELKREPIPFADGGMFDQTEGYAHYGFSNTGLLLYQPGGPITYDQTAASMDSLGRVFVFDRDPHPYGDARPSPDGQRLVICLTAPTSDIWVFNVRLRTFSRLTFGDGKYSAPIWTPDGKYVVYTRERRGSQGVFRKRWDGGGPEETLTESMNGQIPKSITPDGRVLAFLQDRDIWLLSMEDDRTTRPYVQSTFNEEDPAFSPDGRWMAYVSNVTGKREVYVESFPEKGATWQVSSGGGSLPMWGKTGRELYYVTASAIMLASLTLQPDFKVSSQRKLLDLKPEIRPLAFDGNRFIVLVTPPKPLGGRLEAVVDWFSELNEKFSK